jgi:hypothetical protein
MVAEQMTALTAYLVQPVLKAMQVLQLVCGRPSHLR